MGVLGGGAPLLEPAAQGVPGERDVPGERARPGERSAPGERLALGVLGVLGAPGEGVRLCAFPSEPGKARRIDPSRVWKRRE